MGSDSAFLRSADAATPGPACPGWRRGQESGRHRPEPTFAGPEDSGMKKGRRRGEGGRGDSGSPVQHPRGRASRGSLWGGARRTEPPGTIHRASGSSTARAAELVDDREALVD